MEPVRPAPDAAVVVAAYGAGEPLKALAARLGLDDKTVLTMVRRAGQPTRMPRLTEEVRQQIVARYREHAGVTEIASALGISRATVYRGWREDRQTSDRLVRLCPPRLDDRGR